MLRPDWLTHPRRVTGEQLVRYSLIVAVAAHAMAIGAFVRLAQLEGRTEAVLGLAWAATHLFRRRLHRWGTERSRSEFYEAQRRPLRPELSGF